jgi:hypothetical protein
MAGVSKRLRLLFLFLMIGLTAQIVRRSWNPPVAGGIPDQFVELGVAGVFKPVCFDNAKFDDVIAELSRIYGVRITTKLEYGVHDALMLYPISFKSDHAGLKECLDRVIDGTLGMTTDTHESFRLDYDVESGKVVIATERGWLHTRLYDIKPVIEASRELQFANKGWIFPDDCEVVDLNGQLVLVAATPRVHRALAHRLNRLANGLFDDETK